MKDRNLELNHGDIAAVRRRWPHRTGSIDAAHVVNLLPFLTPKERIHFVNELFRVLKKGAKAQLVQPHWCSSLAYSDFAFAWPPVAEAWFPYLNREWRKANAPWSKGYKCDFDHTLGYGLHPSLLSRNQEYQQNAVTYYKEACQSLIVSLTKR